jgi:hypothetical protein
VADAGENEAGDVALERHEKGEFAALKVDDQITLTKFNAVCGREGVNVFGIETERIERRKEVARGGIRGRVSRATQNEKDEQGGANAHVLHVLSVVTFGMQGQGGEKRVSPPA